MTHYDQIKLKPVQYLVKRETALPPLKDDCHSCLAFLGNHQFPIRKDKEVEKNVVKTLGSFLFDAVQPFPIPVKKPITKNAETLTKLFFSKTDNEDLFGRRKSRNNIITEMIWF